LKPLLIVEGLPARARDGADAAGVRIGSELVRRAVHSVAPGLHCEVLFAADAGAALPAGCGLGDFRGVIIGGSSLHAYDDVPEVHRQLELLRAIGAMGLPVYGSCWGLQIAAVVAGGRVRRSDLGREVGVARKIVPTAAGRRHPLLAGKGDCYDALCIHYDGIDVLPQGSTVLAGNAHSAVQAAVVPVGRSEVWGVQYHPEFDLGQMALLMRHYADDMVAQGYYANRADLDAGLAKWLALAAHPGDAASAWQLGLDRDTIDDGFRRLEIANWLAQLS
jgi:GMP synthase (glutamine-hydrolysing)